MKQQQRNKLNTEIIGVIGRALRISVSNPALALFFLKALFRQRRAALRRERLEEEGIHVPPFMIASITRRCNLHCSGCYSRAQGRADHGEISIERLDNLMDEARDLGFAFALLAGGEPLTRPEILDVTARHPQIIYPLFTNGTLLTDTTAARLKRQKNVIPVLSVEGYQRETEARRGNGVYDRLLRAMNCLQENRIFFGISITVTRANLDLVTSQSFARRFAGHGCRLFFYVEYIPVQEGSEQLVISTAQRELLEERMRELRRRFRGVFISFPGDEKSYGGCLAAGRGFVHISPEGGLEPCPFVPYSDTNLQKTTLKQGLSSSFLNRIRASEEHLEENEGGCALWNKRAWVQSLLVHSGAEIAGLARGSIDSENDQIRPVGIVAG